MSLERPAPVRAAVIGTGAISQVMHIPILVEHPGVEVGVLCDTDVHKARAVADRFGVPEAVGPGGVVDRDDLDAVVICTPNHLHEELAIAALDAGKHVFVERPLALAPDGARRVVEAGRRAGTTLVVGLPHRFRPEASALRAYVAGGEMGRIHAVRGIWLNRRVLTFRPGWRQVPELAGGGALVDLGLPSLDLCLWLVGSPRMRRVTCITVPGDHGVEDAAVVFAESENGIAFTLEVSSRYYARHDHYYARVMGSEGSGSLPPLEIFRRLGGRPLEVTPRQPRPRGDEDPYTNAYRRQLDHFVRAVAGLADEALPEDQVALMDVLQAAYRSAREGREVTLSAT
jgi:predicted dehydrogenase